MPIIGEHNIKQGATGAGAGAGYVINNSLLFDDAGNANLSKTFSGSGNRNTYTRSFWMKRSKLGAQQYIFDTGPDGGNNLEALYFGSNDTLSWSINDSNAGQYALTTSAVFRDPTAWTHVVCARDTATMKMYINGVEISDSPSTNTGASNVGRWTHTDQNVIGKYFLNTSQNFGGYLAEIVQIDGQILTPTSFGEFDTNGIWNPKDVSSLTFGTNGFHLDYEVAHGTGNGAGTDVSGRGNHWTSNNIAASDQTTDTPTDFGG